MTKILPLFFCCQKQQSQKTKGKRQIMSNATQVSSSNFVQFLIALGFDLRAAAYRYSEVCWQAWKAAKTKALNNEGDPFQGRPEGLVDRGITQVTKIDGTVVEIAPTTRLRFLELSDDSLHDIGIFHLKGVVTKNVDVVHPEFNPTFAETVAKSRSYLLNNYVAASAALDAVMTWIGNVGLNSGCTTSTFLVTTPFR
jgi:hypothetical protein